MPTLQPRAAYISDLISRMGNTNGRNSGPDERQISLISLSFRDASEFEYDQYPWRVTWLNRDETQNPLRFGTLLPRSPAVLIDPRIFDGCQVRDYIRRIFDLRKFQLDIRTFILHQILPNQQTQLSMIEKNGTTSERHGRDPFQDKTLLQFTFMTHDVPRDSEVLNC